MFPNSPNSRLALLCVASSLDNIGNKTNVVTSKKEVIGSLRSVTKLEYSTNVSLGLKIDLKVVIQSILYDDSKFVQTKDVLYKVERTYVDAQFIELYLSKSDIEVTP